VKILVRTIVMVAFLGLTSGLLALQRGFFQDFGSREMEPADAGERTEWTFARLHYGGGVGVGFRRGSRWATDYPKADRQFVQGVRRLTRLHARSTEQVVDPGTDELFDWPWLYAVEVGSWGFTETEAQRLRDFLLKGGFLMVDDFHGAFQWEAFTQGMRQVFPDRPIEKLTDRDEIFHVLYDLDQRFQIPSIRYVSTGVTFQGDGVVPGWRGVRDDAGRVMVAICFNMDIGDAWEWADLPQYPERFTSLAYRIGVNYIVYGMTH
jgi:Domain of unknown function (DUF4159)